MKILMVEQDSLSTSQYRLNMTNILKTKNVLYAEDEKGQQELLEETLKFFFKNVYLASNGEEALQIIQEEEIDIAILDIQMPKIDGLEVAKRIKNDNIIIIFLTAYSHQQYMQEAIRIKVEDYLIKPFNLDEFIKIFKRIYDYGNKKEKVHTLKDGKLFYESSNLVEDSTNKIKLGSKEAQLLRLLLKYSPDILTKQIIDEEIWSYEMKESSYRSLVKNLRQKIGKDLITTMPGIGLKY